jgi:hypothetical protein
VRSLVLYADPGRNADTTADSPLPAENYEAAVQSASRSEQVRQQWMEDLKKGNEDAWVALLLIRLENLQELDLVLPEPDYCRHLTRVINDAAKSPFPTHLTKLRHVGFEKAPVWEGSPQFNMTRLAPFLKIPSIRSVNLSGVESGPFKPKENLEITSIRACGMQSLIPEIPALLARCVRLESFKYSSVDQARHFDAQRSDIFNPVPFYNPLYKNRETLKTLSITIDKWINDRLWQTIEYPTRQVIGDLTEFPVLETLQIRLTNLMEFHSDSWEPARPLVDSLPSSLKTLVIVDFQTEALPCMIDHLRELASQCSARFTQLRKMIIRPPGQEGPNDDPRYRANGYMGGAHHIPTTVRELLQSQRQDLAKVTVQFLEKGVEFRYIERYGEIGLFGDD